jgi:CRP-like cAMP-binding protein
MIEPYTPEIAILKNVNLFRDLKQAELGEVADIVISHKFKAGKYIFHEGDPAQQLYVLVDGRIKLTQVSLQGEQIILEHVSPGDAFGVVAVLSNIPYPASAFTINDSILLSWDYQLMNRLMERYPCITFNALRILANRIRDFQNRMLELSTERVERRIANALIRLARQTGKKTDSGILVDLPLTRQDLAELSGTTLYSVSRTLTQWEKSGLVRSKRAQVIITNAHGLVSIAEDLPKRGN